MPEGLDAVIERAVAKDPAERYPTAGELIEAARERQGATPAATRVLSDAPSGRRSASAPPIRRRTGWRRRLAGRGRGPSPLAGRVGRRARRGSRSGLPLLLVAASPRSRRRSRSAAPAAGRGRRRSVWVTSARDGTSDRDRPRTARAGGAAAARARRLRRRGRRRLGLGREPATGRGPADRRDTGTVEQDRRRRPPRRPRLRRRPGLGRRRVDGGVTAINAAGAGSFRRGIAPHQRRCGSPSAPVASGSATRPPARCAASTSAPPCRRADPGRPRPLGHHGRRRRRLGRQQPLRHASPASTPRPGCCSACRSRSAGARRDRRRHQPGLGRQLRRKHRQPDRPRQRRTGRRRDPGRPPPRGGGRRRGRGLGGRQRRRSGDRIEP